MKTAVDSSVLLDVLGASPEFGEASREALRSAFDAGALVACDVVWSEVRAHFPDDEPFERAMDLLGVRFDPLSAQAAELAGALWRRRREGGGRSPRHRVVADLLIGAHAKLHADRLLTRDRGFFRGAFEGLSVTDPSSTP